MILHRRYIIWKLVVMLLLSSSLASAFEISEIHYNPSGSDNNKEFVEVFHERGLNLTYFTIGDLTSNDTLAPVQMHTSSYSLIVEDGFNYSGLNCSVYSVGSTIGNGLGNSGDVITLYNFEREQIAFASYLNTLGNGNDKSIERVNGSWQESHIAGGTPCRGYEEEKIDDNQRDDEDSQEDKENELEEEKDGEVESEADENGFVVEILLDDVLYSQLNYTKPFKISNKNYTRGDEGVPVDFWYSVSTNESVTNYSSHIERLKTYKTSGLGHFFSTHSGVFEICAGFFDVKTCKEVVVLDVTNVTCNVTLHSSMDQTQYNVSDKAKIMFDLNDDSFPYVISYWIEDIFGRVVKKKAYTSNTNTKSWTVKSDNFVDVFVLRSELHTSCKNNNSGAAQELRNGVMFYARKERPSTSQFSILSVPEEVKQGGTLRAKVNLYKGNTSKSSVKLYVANKRGTKISDDVSLLLHEKFKDHVFTTSVKISCDATIGDYFFVISGLEKQIRERVKVVDGNCKKSEEADTGEKSAQTIKSFYTRAKQIDKEISVFGTINADEPVELVLFGGGIKQEQTLDVRKTKQFSFSVPTIEGNNTFVLELRKDGIVVDSKELSVFRASTYTKKVEEEQYINRYVENKQLFETVEKEAVRYEAKSIRHKVYIHYLFIGFVLVFAGILLFEKE